MEDPDPGPGPAFWAWILLSVLLLLLAYQEERSYQAAGVEGSGGSADCGPHRRR